ncbi:type VI secretion system tip protein TssI/VgrG [Sorangium sp. So ce136]|uniref:type VI secretion system Vgr family protein n=1 Tax=Sorangium sp. So ce136 TaxID=3133284 RepID=UPI003F0B1282
MAAFGIHIESAGLGPCDVLRVTGDEAMNALPLWEAEVLSERGDLELDAAPGSSVQLSLLDAQEGSSRVLDLLLIEIAYEGEERAGHRYTLVLSAAPWTLTLRSGYRVFLDKAVQEIIPEVLHDAGVPQDRIVLRLAGEYEARPQCTQYDESDWEFVERLLAEEGISYWFDRDEGKGVVIVLGDSPGAYDGITPPLTLPFAEPTDTVRARTFSSLEVSEEVTTTAVTLRDFDVNNPGVYIEGDAGEGALFHFEYPAFVSSSEAAKVRAKVRLEQLQQVKVRAAGVTDCLRVQPGRVLEIDGVQDDWMNGRYLVVAQRCNYRRPASHDAAARPFRSDVTLVPLGDAPFRPAIPRRQPRVEGIETAVITGPPGEEIHVDPLGRVKLRFPWDPSGTTDDRSSAWARCLQWNMTGAMFLPRVGWEVPVAYLDGCPDRPFVLQRLYNATAVTPYPLPGAAATSSIKSATSPGGEGGHEIMMSDKAGAEKVGLHAGRDHSVAVGNNASTEVGSDETHDIGQILTQFIGGSQTGLFGAFQTLDVGADWATKIEGATTTIVAAMERQHVKANRAVVASGLYAELIGAGYLLTCNQSNMKVEGVFTQMNGAGSALHAGISVSEVVAGVRFERVGGPYLLRATSGVSDSVYGAKRISSSGAATENAGGDVVTSAPIGKVEADTVAITAGGKIAIQGTQVTLEASSLLAGALKLDGGALQVTRGVAKIEGASVKIPAGAKLG